jgi:hypothetical protein
MRGRRPDSRHVGALMQFVVPVRHAVRESGTCPRNLRNYAVGTGTEQGPADPSGTVALLLTDVARTHQALGDSMLHRLRIIGLVVLLAFAATARVVGAQDASPSPQDRYIEELKQRNAAYGPGCNGIGISVPATQDMPADITSRWAAGHSACIPDLRLVMACIGEVVDEDRVISCTLQVADGQGDGTISCEQFALITPSARVTPDATLSDALGEASEGGSRSCSEPQDIAAGATFAAAFLVPATESRGDLAVMIDVDGSEVPAFLIPAGQLDGELPPES